MFKAPNPPFTAHVSLATRGIGRRFCVSSPHFSEVSVRIRIHAVLLLLVALPISAARLPRTVFPSHYNLTITPDFATDTFAGTVVIDVTAAAPVDEIVLNAAELEISSAEVRSGSDRFVAAVTPRPDDETISLRVPKKLPLGPASISLNFTGHLNDKLHGLYLGHANGRKYAATQFESTDARRAFPCFDEPEMKATFAITAVVDRGDVAISNGAVLSDTPGPNNKHTVRFATTPRLSTYVTALVVGDFKSAETNVDGIPVRIWATPDRIGGAQFALDATREVLRYYNAYYGIPYPFGKLDQIAIPDFAAGAMENAGAIVYRETALLVDPNAASASSKRRVAATIAHEIAHQWFGDLVTMRWWDDIWLNEGFASWMETKPVAKWKPEWQIALEQVDASSRPMTGDALRATRKIRTSADTPQEIEQLFDAIAYNKTAAVLRMVESYVGEEKFRQGVNNYLASRAYGNATADDFIGALAGSGAGVENILRSYITQPGVPLVRLTEKCENDHSVVTATQERFFTDRNIQLTDAERAQLWTIPLCFDKPGDATPDCRLLTQKQQTFTVNGCSAPLAANANGSGYYVVSYDDVTAKRLRESVASLEPTERYALLRDEWALVRAGQRSVGDYLTLTTAFRNESSRSVIEQLLSPMSTIATRLADDKSAVTFRKYVGSLVRPMLNTLGWEPKKGELEEQDLLRGQLIRTLVTIVRDPADIAQARRYADRYFNDPRSVDPTLASTFVEAAAAADDEAYYDRVLNAFKSATTPEQRSRAASALGAFRSPKLVKRTIDFAVSDEVRRQDAPGLVRGLLFNAETSAAAWAYIEANWDRVTAKIPARSLAGYLGGLCDPAALAEARGFFEKHPSPDATRGVAQTIERAQQCIAFREAQAANFAQWAEQAGR